MNWERIYRIIETEGMTKSERKVSAVIHNAQCFLNVREEFGTFSDYLWGFTNGKIILYMGHQKGGHPYKEKCACAQRNKRLYISKSILEKCQKSYENIPSEKITIGTKTCRLNKIVPSEWKYSHSSGNIVIRVKDCLPSEKVQSDDPSESI